MSKSKSITDALMAEGHFKDARANVAASSLALAQAYGQEEIKLTPAMQRCIDTGKIVTYGIGNMHMVDNGFVFSHNKLGDKFYLNPDIEVWAKLEWINTNAWQIKMVEGEPTW